MQVNFLMSKVQNLEYANDFRYLNVASLKFTSVFKQLNKGVLSGYGRF